MNSNIEDIYPLSPMQRGMLFHNLLSKESGVYIEQTCCTFEGTMDIESFKLAWEKIVERHSVLRTAFVWEDVDEPLQIVYKSVALPFKILDWQDIPDKEEKLEELLKMEVEEGFDTETAPLMKMAIIKADAGRYYFVWTLHHVIFDGWSAQIIIREVFEFYYSLINKCAFNLKAVRPFRDYISWLQKQDMQKAEAFWRNALKGLMNTTSLRFPAPGKMDGAYLKLQMEINPETSAAVYAFCRKNRLTMNTLIQGLWALILGAYCGEEDIIFGTTVSGRPAELPNIDSTVGLFINTLPVRIKIEPEMSFANWLVNMQIEQAGQRKYEYCALTDIQGWSQIPREIPLFESIVVFENYPLSQALSRSKDNITIKDVKSHSRTNYPLTIVLGTGEEIAIEMAYDESRFREDDIKALLAHFKVLLSNVSLNAQKKLNEISILSSAEEAKILTEYSQGSSSNLDFTSIPELFESIAFAYPDIAACRMNGLEISYMDLKRKADRLASNLIHNGVTGDTIVALIADRSIEMIVGIMGILKSGAAFLPIDPTYPEERIHYMLEDSNVKLILTQSHLVDKIPSNSWKVILIDSEEMYTSKDKPPEVEIYPENLAYVIYTSGSTGMPKGTMLSHIGVINLINVKKEVFHLTPGKRILQFSSLSFDASVCEIFMALLTGSTLCLCEKEDILSGQRLIKYLAEEEINFFLSPPSYISVLPESALPDLDVLVTGGEAATWGLIEKWSKGRKYFNAYGPTEATVCTTLHECSLEDMKYSPTPPIGRPISNLRTYILDRNMHPVPIGALGELYIGGIGLARGYLGRPDLSAEKFLPDPFSAEKGSRLYRTGDLVRYLNNGNIEFLGRIDHQVKLRGFRIELQEIESQMKSYSGVKEAVVILREDHQGDKRLVGYIVAGEDIDTRGLQAYLRTKLPEYMVPSYILRLERLPLNTSGKVDRKSLPAPLENQYKIRNERQKNINEEILANIWADILNLEKVGLEDNFFELGGHSLLATQVISRIRDAFRIEVPFSILFEEKTLSSLAERIESIVRSDKQFPDKPVKYEMPERIPLSFAQQRLWFLDKLQSGMSSYNIPSAIKIEGQINIEILSDAINIVARRHQVLRTIFSEFDGQPVQVIIDDIKADINVTNISMENGKNTLEEVNCILESVISRPFNLQEGPLFRIHILILSKNESIVLFVIHHIIADGWSMPILIHEVASAYESFIKNKDLLLPELNLQYSDYSIWQNRMFEAGKFTHQLNYWKERLSNIPLANGLHTDFPRKAILSTNGNTVSDLLGRDLLKELLELSRKEGATLFMTLLAAFNVLLHKYSGQMSISVGAPVAGRVRTEIENLIGFFVNNVVLVTEFETGLTFKELLKRVRTASLDAYANQDVPFEKVVEAVSPVRDLSRSPLFQVMFVFQNFRARQFDIVDLKISSYPLQTTASNFDLSMILNESEDGLMLALEYNSDLFMAETIERMLLHYKNIIKSVLADPEINIEELNMLDIAEEKKILRGWNSTAKEYTSAMSISDMFNNIAAENPAGSAAVMATPDGTITEELSYSGLNLRSERLSSFLMQNQIGKEDIVALIADRSIEMIVGIMGILKSGAAFLPIDPTYPEERIHYMLEDSKAKLILTQSHLLDKIPQTGKKILLLDAEEIYSVEGKPQEVKIYPENLAYIIYTSGSTGKPKGTMLSHKGVVNLTCVQKEAFHLSPGKRILQFSSLSFDASVWEIFMTLLNGATLCLCDRDITLSGEKLKDYLKNNRINVLTVPPTVLSYIPTDLLSNLDILVTAGEAATWSLIEKWSKGRRYFNAYGPTEATVCTTLHECSLEDAKDSQTPPIGRPISNLRTYILDRNMHPAPVGAQGELYIGGIGLARGYLGRPDLTAEKFLPDPFSGEKGNRLYRTGDLVRYLKNGNIEFLGRIDHQIKLRGFRIELQEIESQMKSYDKVKEAVVILREDHGGEKRLVGYVAASSGEEFETRSLQAYLRTKLPEYMLPSVIIKIESMPLNTSGKIDRKSLETAGLNLSLNKREYAAPNTPAEKEVARIVSELLNIEKVGIYDNFFELGGHSLMASQLVSRIRESMCIEVPLRLIFEKPVLSDLSLEIEMLGNKKDGNKTETIKPVSRNSYRAIKSEFIK